MKVALPHVLPFLQACLLFQHLFSFLEKLSAWGCPWWHSGCQPQAELVDPVLPASEHYMTMRFQPNLTSPLDCPSDHRHYFTSQSHNFTSQNHNFKTCIFDGLLWGFDEIDDAKFLRHVVNPQSLLVIVIIIQNASKLHLGDCTQTMLDFLDLLP